MINRRKIFPDLYLAPFPFETPFNCKNLLNVWLCVSIGVQVNRVCGCSYAKEE